MNLGGCHSEAAIGDWMVLENYEVLGYGKCKVSKLRVT